MPDAAVYYRVSKQDGSQTTDNQIPDVESLARARGDALPPALCFAEQESAAKSRPVFQKMLEAAGRGRFRTLYIWAIDRFGRNLAGNLDDFRRLAACGVKVVSVREPWLEQEGPTRDLMVAIFSWVAQQERARLIERTNAGLARARKEGVKLGRPRVPRDAMERCRALVVAGASVRGAAAQVSYVDGKGKCKVVSESALRAYLLDVRGKGDALPVPGDAPAGVSTAAATDAGQGTV
jgi:DNA invertase Pin-like site-specific DNA recombinase